MPELIAKGIENWGNVGLSFIFFPIRVVEVVMGILIAGAQHKGDACRQILIGFGFEGFLVVSSGPAELEVLLEVGLGIGCKGIILPNNVW